MDQRRLIQVSISINKIHLRIDDISLIIMKKNNYSKILNHENFVFKNFIEKEKFLEEQRRENKDLIMNKGFINENSKSSELKNYSSINNSNSILSLDKLKRINDISIKLEKNFQCNKNNIESNSTLSISSYIKKNYLEPQNKKRLKINALVLERRNTKYKY